MKKKIEDNPNLIKDESSGAVLTVPGGLDAARKAKRIALEKQKDSETIKILLERIEKLEKRVSVLERKKSI